MKQLLIMACGAVWLAATGAQAQDHMIGRRPCDIWAAEHRAAGEQMMVESLAGTLDLSDRQLTKWKAIREGKEAAIAPLLEQVRARHESIHTLLESDGADPTEVGQLMIEAHSIQAQIRSADESARKAFHAILTADQRDRLTAFQESMERHRPVPGPGFPPLEP